MTANISTKRFLSLIFTIFVVILFSGQVLAAELSPRGREKATFSSAYQKEFGLDVYKRMASGEKRGAGTQRMTLSDYLKQSGGGYLTTRHSRSYQEQIAGKSITPYQRGRISYEDAQRGNQDTSRKRELVERQAEGFYKFSNKKLINSPNVQYSLNKAAKARAATKSKNLTRVSFRDLNLINSNKNRVIAADESGVKRSGRYIISQHTGRERILSDDSDDPKRDLTTKRRPELLRKQYESAVSRKRNFDSTKYGESRARQQRSARLAAATKTQATKIAVDKIDLTTTTQDRSAGLSRRAQHQSYLNRKGSSSQRVLSDQFNEPSGGGQRHLLGELRTKYGSSPAQRRLN